MDITTARRRRGRSSVAAVAQANVGSAVNDTAWPVALRCGGAGSLVASHPVVRSVAITGLPAKATHSLAEALQHAAAVGGVRGGTIANAAKVSYVDAFNTTLWVGTVVVIVASCIVAWLLRPAATERIDAENGAQVAVEAA